MDDRDVAQFIDARNEAAMWCEFEGQRAGFRTQALRPTLDEWPAFGEFDRALSTLRQRRRELLGARVTEHLPPGRLLLCQVHESVSSGESELETSGFFDIDDRPPWDTWVWVFESTEPGCATLVSWVPHEWESLVGRGIEVNAYGCIYWFTDQPTGAKPMRAIRTLLAAGIR